MQASFKQYEAIAQFHKHAIQQEGFSSAHQLNYKNSILRKVWRKVRRGRWVGWKTYWKACHPSYGKCFLKVSFGHDTLPAEQACVDAENEVYLSAYFDSYIEDIQGVRSIKPLKHWKTNDPFSSYFIIYPWEDHISHIQLSRYLAMQDNRRNLTNLLSRLSTIPAPPWWGKERETHNFACTDYTDGKDVFCNPFNVDFFHNLAINQIGDLFFFDLEKYQWSNPGLQEVTLALYLLSTQTGLMDDYVTCILSHVKHPAREAVMNQAWKVVENRRVPWRIPVLTKEQKYELTQRVLSHPCVSIPE